MPWQAPRVQMWERACVGAGLLANAVGQQRMYSLIHRIREQARSHMGSPQFVKGAILP